MLLGFNTNVRHRGVLFHVQTEDSGKDRPRVITHLYHQGTILASERKGYEELLGAPDTETRVRALMDEQHRTMMQRLRAGAFDAVIVERLGPSTFPDAPAPASAEAPSPVAEAPPPASARPASPSAPEPAALPMDEAILQKLVAKARKRKRMSR